MRWGANIEFLIKEKERGEYVPALENRPVLLPHLFFYMEAFDSLRYDRPIGMAMGPIPWSSLDRYATRYDIDEFDIFEGHIRSMEAVLMEHEAKKQ